MSGKKSGNEDENEQYDGSDVDQSEDGSEGEQSPGMSSEGENALRQRRNQSGEEELSDGGSPIPAHNEAGDDKGKVNVFFWGFVALVMAAGLLGLYYAGQPDSIASSHPLMADVTNVIKKFNLSTAVQKNMMATFSEMIEGQRPVVVLVASSEPSHVNPAVTQCLFKSLIRKFSDHYKPQSEAKKIDLRNSLASIKEKCTDGDVSRCVSNKFVELFQTSLKNSKVLWLDGLEALNYEPGLVVSMNSFADHSEAPVKDSLIFITANFEGDAKKPITSATKTYFQKIWTKNSKGCKVGEMSCLTTDNFHAVWTRIGDFVIDAKGLSSLPDFC